MEKNEVRAIVIDVLKDMASCFSQIVKSQVVKSQVVKSTPDQVVKSTPDQMVKKSIPDTVKQPKKERNLQISRADVSMADIVQQTKHLVEIGQGSNVRTLFTEKGLAKCQDCPPDMMDTLYTALVSLATEATI